MQNAIHYGPNLMTPDNQCDDEERGLNRVYRRYEPCFRAWLEDLVDDADALYPLGELLATIGMDIKADVQEPMEAMMYIMLDEISETYTPFMHYNLLFTAKEWRYVNMLINSCNTQFVGHTFCKWVLDHFKVLPPVAFLMADDLIQSLFTICYLKTLKASGVLTNLQNQCEFIRDNI